MRSLGFNVRWLLRNQLALSIDLHHHEIIMINVVFNKMISLREVNEIPMILELGAKAVAAEKDEILAAIKNFSMEKTPDDGNAVRLSGDEDQASIKRRQVKGEE